MTECSTFAPTDLEAPLIFAEEQPISTPPTKGTWKIMLVDDDPAIHQATKVALKFFIFEEKTLHFISAHSGQEAKALIQEHPDTALILLDVIMETSDAGLQVAQYIREVLKNRIVRIILRTGQPGQVPEESVILSYDINDYKTKLELTQQKLFTTLVASLRSFRDLLALQQSQETLAALNQDLQTFNQNLEQLVHERTLALEQNNQHLTHEIEERQRAEEALRVYIHALTHDLRNPVTGMAAVLTSLQNRPMTGEDTDPQVLVPACVLQRMSAGCDRQLKMINTLIEAHKIDVWGVSLERQPFSLSRMVRTLAAEWEPSFSKKRMQVSYDIAPDLPQLNGDRDQIWRVFENIFANVVKYNPPGIQVTVMIETKVDSPNLICCTITDTGVGIDEAQLRDLFELYQRARPRPASGLGIGLYICRQIIEAHGGKIWMNSQLGQGTECCFILPTV